MMCQQHIDFLNSCRVAEGLSLVSTSTGTGARCQNALESHQTDVRVCVYVIIFVFGENQENQECR